MKGRCGCVWPLIFKERQGWSDWAPDQLMTDGSDASAVVGESGVALSSFERSGLRLCEFLTLAHQMNA